MTDDDSKRVIFSFDKKKLTLRAQGTESGRSRVELPLDYDGKGVEIGFDPKFVLDMLRVLEPDAALTAASLRCTGKEAPPRPVSPASAARLIRFGDSGGRPKRAM